MIEDLYNYLRSEGGSPRQSALETNNMPSKVVDSAETSDQYQQDVDFTEPYVPLTTTEQTTEPPPVVQAEGSYIRAKRKDIEGQYFKVVHFPGKNYVTVEDESGKQFNLTTAEIDLTPVARKEVKQTPPQPTEPPLIRLEYRQRPGGAVAEQKNAFKSTYNINKEYINNVYDTQILPDGIEYATLIYSNLPDRLPVVNRNGQNVPLQIAEFEKEMKSNPAVWQSVIQQASEYENDPSLPYEAKYQINENNFRSILLLGAVSEMENIMNKELFKAAQINSAFTKTFDLKPFEMMFGEDGRIVDEKTYKKRLNKSLNDVWQNWLKNNPDPYTVYKQQLKEAEEKRAQGDKFARAFAPHSWQRSDMDSWLNYGNIVRGQFVVPRLLRNDKGDLERATYQEKTDKDGNLIDFVVPTGEFETYSLTNSTYKGSIEEYGDKYQGMFNSISKYRKKFGDYDFMMKNIIAVYDGQNPDFIKGKKISAEDFAEASDKGVGTRLSTHQQYMMFPSKGGAVTVPVKYTSFDYRKNYNKGTYDEKKQKWSHPDGIPNDNIKEVNRLLWLFDKDDVVYTIGSNSDAAKDGIEGNIPKRDQETHNMIKAGVNIILDHVDEANKYLYSKKGERKKYALPEGTVTFVPIAGGSEDYMAFNIRFKTPFFEDSKIKKLLFGKGEKFEDPKTLKESYKDQGPWFNIKDQIVNNGITLYLPASVARNSSELAEFHQSSKTVGGVEGLLAMTNKPVNILVPGAGQISFTKAGNNIIVGGSTFNISDNGMKIDTVPLQNDTVPYTDILSFDLEAMNLLHSYLAPRQKQNMLIMDQLKKQYATKVPDKLLNFRTNKNILQRPNFPSKGTGLNYENTQSYRPDLEHKQ